MFLHFSSVFMTNFNIIRTCADARCLWTVSNVLLIKVSFSCFLVSLKFEASLYKTTTTSTHSAELINFEATRKVKIFHFGFNLVSSSDDRKSTTGFQSPSGLNLTSSSPSLSSKGFDFSFLKLTSWQIYTAGTLICWDCERNTAQNDNGA